MAAQDLVERIQNLPERRRSVIFLRRRTETNIYITQFLYRVKLTYQARLFTFFVPLS